ncbi:MULTISPECIES: bacteriochlorophyll 4-vinyl reductase [Rhodopseudomonas]|uniref:Bacteriochlorophyll 4-vinyl reductase n=1 Tax=Rhodopseudomonas palustris TaxID=1076 RepID=A0A0D7EH63_RHOPL|nr:MULTISPECIES: bacteriochlorophyll 4-vinyl reductase [Rhodopseudomonas]KIZ40098.1 bacteriochlorophyll 4-vinyl reductase [Rhodopseudomonas palustris]WOK17921.1 bacteriochlorophyll 4-vinyl reductase [Rhodopseudomonas sp. BAL398]
MKQAPTPTIDAGGVQAIGSAAATAKIGPNAVTQLINALDAAGLQPAAAAIFAEAGIADWLSDPPTAMVDERPVALLHQTLRKMLSPQQSVEILADAGRRTADYILAFRIPKPAQFVLKLLPAPLAARMLVAAIRAHAWTFAGSGRFSGLIGKSVTFEIAANPLCAGEHSDSLVCVWHAAVFQRLFQVLVSPNTRVVETSCGARGDDCCRFVADWRSIPDAANIYASRRARSAAGSSETLSAH